jgi:serine/threonine protein kinase
MIGKMLGHYRITSQLGKGGMGEVYLADDLNLNRKVALKFLPEAFAADPERMTRFERGANLLAIQIATAFLPALPGPASQMNLEP